jgi:hypothetical protein
MGVPLLWDLCPKNMVPQMAWCHQTGYRGFILEKSLSKSPRHQRSVNRVNPGVATRLRARLRGKDLRIRREMVTFVHWERWLWVTNPDEAPRTAGCWFFISKMRQLPNLPTTWPYGVAVCCGSWGKTSTRFWEEHRFTMIYHLFWCSPEYQGFDP